MRIRLGVIASLLFGSGFAALVYQTIWQKTFRFIFGATGEASAAVLAIFLGGLGLGGALLGRRAEKSTQPLVLYGNLEIGVALWAAISPFLIMGASALYARLGGSIALGASGATIVRLLLATLAIGPAAFLMGGTLPAAARAAVADDDSARSGLAQIYALNTLGAVLGALVGPLVLFGTVGIKLTLWSVVCVNLLVGLCARAIGRSQNLEPTRKAEPEVENEAAKPGLSKVPPRLVYGLAALVGFAFLYMELVWFRMLAPILGGSTITFGLILALALLGIFLGGFLYSFVMRADRGQASLTTLTFTLAVEALFIALPFALGDDLAMLTSHLRQAENLGYTWLLMGWASICAVVVLPAAIVSGYQFPVIFSLLGQGRRGVAKEVGTAYAANTVGTILGSLLGGFLLIPWLGATLSWRVVAILLGAASLALCVYQYKALLGSWRAPALAFVIAASFLLCGARGPGDVWRHTPIGAGRSDLSQHTRNSLINYEHHTARTITWQADGVEAAIGVDVGDGVSFLVNGKSDGSVVGDRGTQVMLGLIPAVVHPKPRRAFVVGLGTGTTAGMLGLVPSIERVDVAEIEQQILHVAKMASSANAHVLDNPKVHILHGDARELIIGAVQKYDLIVSEPSNPYRVGVSSLFTKEFYELSAEKLAPGGFFAQWIQGYEIDAFALSTAIRTLKSEFKHVSLWSTQGGDLVLLASQEPQVLRVDSLKPRLSQEPLRSWFVRARSVEGVEAFAAQQIFPPESMRLLLEAVPGLLNTDDLNYLEFSFAHLVGAKTSVGPELFQLMDEKGLLPALHGTYDRAALNDARQRLQPDLPSRSSRAAQGIALACKGTMTRGLSMLPADFVPDDVVERYAYGFGLAMSGREDALKEATVLEGRGFRSEAELIRARLALKNADYKLAGEHLFKTYAALRHAALPLCDTTSRALDVTVRLATADASLIPSLTGELAKDHFAAYQVEEGRLQTLLTLSTMMPLSSPGALAACARAYETFDPYPIWDEPHLRQRVLCYQKTGSPRALGAAEDLLSYLSAEPSHYLDQSAIRSSAPVPPPQAPGVANEMSPDLADAPEGAEPAEEVKLVETEGLTPKTGTSGAATPGATPDN